MQNYRPLNKQYTNKNNMRALIVNQSPHIVKVSNTNKRVPKYQELGQVERILSTFWGHTYRTTITVSIFKDGTQFKGNLSSGRPVKNRNTGNTTAYHSSFGRKLEDYCKAKRLNLI